jgi:hypothetical protein
MLPCHGGGRSGELCIPNPKPPHAFALEAFEKRFGSPSRNLLAFFSWRIDMMIFVQKKSI